MWCTTIDLSIKPDQVELSHLYYLLKAHTLNTPVRYVIAGLKDSTIKISGFLDNLLRPLFNQMAKQDTVESAFELIKKLDEWSKEHMKKETIFCSIDVTDLYAMIPQIEGISSLRKMMGPFPGRSKRGRLRTVYLAQKYGPYYH